MKKFFLLPFNMVEIALALAIVGMGVAGVMTLFPVGFNSIRDAMAESYGADIAEEFIGQLSRACKSNWEDLPGPPLVPGWIGTSDDTGIIRRPAPTDMTSDWNDVEKGARLIGDIYYTNRSDIFLVERRTGDIVDFEAHIQIWKEPIRNLNVAGQNIDFADASMTAHRYEFGAMIYARISWPVSKPYSAREIRTYCKEVFNPK